MLKMFFKVFFLPSLQGAPDGHDMMKRSNNSTSSDPFGLIRRRNYYFAGLKPSHSRPRPFRFF